MYKDKRKRKKRRNILYIFMILYHLLHMNLLPMYYKFNDFFSETFGQSKKYGTPKFDIFDPLPLVKLVIFGLDSPPSHVTLQKVTNSENNVS